MNFAEAALILLCVFLQPPISAMQEAMSEAERCCWQVVGATIIAAGTALVAWTAFSDPTPPTPLTELLARQTDEAQLVKELYAYSNNQIHDRHFCHFCRLPTSVCITQRKGMMWVGCCESRDKNYFICETCMHEILRRYNALADKPATNLTIDCFLCDSERWTQRYGQESHLLNFVLTQEIGLVEKGLATYYGLTIIDGATV